MLYILLNLLIKENNEIKIKQLNFILKKDYTIFLAIN